MLILGTLVFVVLVILALKPDRGCPQSEMDDKGKWIIRTRLPY